MKGHPPGQGKVAQRHMVLSEGWLTLWGGRLFWEYCGPLGRREAGDDECQLVVVEEREACLHGLASDAPVKDADAEVTSGVVVGLPLVVGDAG